jgi:Zn-dependent protease
MYAMARPPRTDYTSSSTGGFSAVSPSLRPGRLTRNEVISFVLGAALVWLVGYSILQAFTFPRSEAIPAFYANSILFVFAFLFHEYAHKYAANRNGLRAEFKLLPFGIALTVLSIFTPFFRIIAPGVTTIYGVADLKTMGRIAEWGPLVNIITSVILFPIILFIPFGPLFSPAFYFSTLIPLFNLIPIGILDGQKVFRWNKAVWGLSFLYSLASFIFSLYLLGLV